jgi:uncharacterized protein (TIGR03435 family)
MIFAMSRVSISLSRAVLILTLIGTLGMPMAETAQTGSTQSPMSASGDKSADQLPVFEVATIKPEDPNATHFMDVAVSPGGRVRISGMPLKTLIVIAFRLSWWQISGDEGWMKKDLYTLEAKPTEGPQPASWDVRHTLFSIEDARLRQMLQALLIDRFQLKFHIETKEGPVFLLERNGKPLHLTPTKRPNIAGEVGRVSGNGVQFFNMSMPQLAKFFADHVVERTVLDKTSLNGSFDFESKDKLTDSDFGSAADPAGFQDRVRDSFLSALKEAGLKLTPASGPVESLVIDYASQPSPN